MRLHDVVASSQQDSLTHNIFLTNGKPNYIPSIVMSSFFLRAMEYVKNESALLRARRETFLRFQFSLERNDEL